MSQPEVVEQIRQLLLRVTSGETLELSDHDLAVLGARIADNVARGLRGRVPKERTEKVLYFSEIGKPCHRQVWYNHKGYQGEQLDPSALIKFMYGDILEELVLFLAEQSGSKVKERQAYRTLDIGDGWVVRGRIDAVINDQLVDVKSATTPSFDKITSGKLAEDDAFGYLSQLYGYWVASDGDEKHAHRQPAFLVIDKTLGHIGFASYEAEMSEEEIIEKVVDKAISLRDDVLKSEPPERPFSPQPDGKSGNMKLPVACSYCAHKHTCWAEANDGKGLRTFFYSNGPRFLTHVEREPDVPEQK